MYCGFVFHLGSFCLQQSGWCTVQMFMLTRRCLTSSHSTQIPLSRLVSFHDVTKRYIMQCHSIYYLLLHVDHQIPAIVTTFENQTNSNFLISIGKTLCLPQARPTESTGHTSPTTGVPASH